MLAEDRLEYRVADRADRRPRLRVGRRRLPKVVLADRLDLAVVTVQDDLARASLRVFQAETRLTVYRLLRVILNRGELA